MDERTKQIIESLDKNIRLQLDEYDFFIKSLDFDIDQDFTEFCKLYDGAQGFLSSSNYLQLWNIDDIITLNPYYVDIEECNNLYFFGSNGSNLGFAFNKENDEIVSIDFLEISLVKPKFLSNNFYSFLKDYSSYDFNLK